MSAIRTIFGEIPTGEFALGSCLSTLKDMGVVCTYSAELDKFAAVCMILGMAIGAICVLVFQYTRRKIQEREPK